MKRLLSLVCICALLLWGMPLSVHAAEYEYTVADGQVTITSWDENATGVVVVPEYIDGYPVTAIDDFAFVMHEGLTEVYLPETVETIGEGAFWHCTNLRAIHLPSTMTSIGFSAFAYCASLTDFRIPDGVSELPENLFLLCESLQTVTIPDSVTEIESFAFNQCSALQEVEIPAGVSTIRQSTFAFCTSLTKVTLPDSLTVIEDYAFYGCGELKYMAAPEVYGLLAGLEGFDLTMLQGAVLPSALTSIGAQAFYCCYNLWYMLFPGDAPVFGDDCFGGTYPSGYYHAGNPTWTEDVLQDYGGTVYWFGIHCFFNYVSDGNATCTADGTMTAKCELCDATDTVVEEGSMGHRYVDGVCIRCGDGATGLLGDVNGDGKVNMKDWNRLYEHLNEVSTLPDSALPSADTNRDGKVNMKDWARLYEHINEINPL